MSQSIRFTPILYDEIPQALELIRQSEVLPLQNGLMDYGWRWGEPSAEGLDKPVRQGHAWWWRGKQGLLTYWDDEDENKKFPVLHLIACSVDALPECLLDFRRLAVNRGYDHVEWNALSNAAAAASARKSRVQAVVGRGVVYVRESAPRIGIASLAFLKQPNGLSKKSIFRITYRHR